MEAIPKIHLWYYPELEADEGLESWVQRCAHLYSVNRDTMLGHLLGRPTTARERYTDLDTPDAGISFPSLLPKRSGAPRSTDCGPLLDPAARGAYCPLCFKNDLRAERIPYLSRIAAMEPPKIGVMAPLASGENVVSDGWRIRRF